MTKLGFGFLRLPKKGGSYDWDGICRMTDAFLQGGGRYFDTCYTYLDGASEQAIRECLVKRHPRESFLLADKLPGYKCTCPEDNRKYFDEELARCGVDHFDVYMLHWLNADNYAAAEKHGQFEFISRLKEKGLVRRIGFSYHDSAELLDTILTRHPETEIVQLQINYLDWDSAGIQSRLCYEVCEKHGKEIYVMEPVKGGTLAALPAEAESILRALRPERSPAEWALAFVRGLPRVRIALSGMNELSQVYANLPEPEYPTAEELEALRLAAEAINGATAVPCTGCRYCAEHCPMAIAIPDFFKMYNEICRYPSEGWKIKPTYARTAEGRGRASQCVACGACAAHCPQGIDIPGLMAEVAAKLE